MKNWLTTVLGAATAVGMFLSHSTSTTLSTIGNIAQYIGVTLLGLSAKDASTKS